MGKLGNGTEIHEGSHIRGQYEALQSATLMTSGAIIAGQYGVQVGLAVFSAKTLYVFNEFCPSLISLCPAELPKWTLAHPRHGLEEEYPQILA